MGCVLELLRVLNYRPTLDGCALQITQHLLCLLTLRVIWRSLRSIFKPQCLKWYIPNSHYFSTHTKEKKECSGEGCILFYRFSVGRMIVSLSLSNGMISHCMCHEHQLTLDRQFYVHIVSFSQGGWSKSLTGSHGTQCLKHIHWNSSKMGNLFKPKF